MVDVDENDTGVFVFEDLNACSEELTKELEKYSYEVVVLGLDCEWVSQDRKEVEEESPVCPVALLQLAFPHGRCFLIRLCQMNARLPDKLRDILEERNILKTGVGIGEDAKKLSSCYGLVVQGCVDLRHVASRCRGYVQHCVGEGGTRHGMSLSALSQQILGVTLDKDWRIRCSNWEAPSLSERQIEYAANDAIVAVKILFKLAASKLREKEERFEAGNTEANDNNSSSQTGLEDNSCGSKEVLLEPEANFETSETEIKMGVQCTESSSADEIEKRVLGKDNVFIFDEDSPERTRINSEIPKIEIKMGAQCTESSSADEIEKRVLGKDNVFRFDEDSPERTSINSENSDSRQIEKRVLESSLPEQDNTESTSISSEGGILSGLSKVSGFSLGSMFGTQAEPKDRKSEVYSQYPSFKNLEVTEGLLTSSELWSCLSALCQGVVDVPFKVKSKQKNSKAQNNEKSKQGSSTQTKALQSGVIDDLDGEMPSTCDKRSACCRKLGAILPLESNNCFVNFKGGKCVVCGRDDYYMRKNVIPHDYRKHFPICMKDHHSHDVLLLCPPCHQISIHQDDMLRKKLAEKYNAPLGNQGPALTSSQAARLVELKKVKSAAKALLKAGEKIPANRREVLYSTVKVFFEGENPTDEMLLRAAGMETRQENCYFISHGREVVQKVKEDRDLLNFERMWREHFLETMKPKYLPLFWTVYHGQEFIIIIILFIYFIYKFLRID